MALILPPFTRPAQGMLKPPVTPGSLGYGAGTFSIVIPWYNTLTMQIWGAGSGGGGITDTGGGAAGPNNYQGGNPSYSYFAAPSGTIYAYGGQGGWNGSITTGRTGSSGNGAAGAGGAASGGDYNYTGSGQPGGSGASGVTVPSGATYYGGNGGPGGFVQKSWTYGAPGSPVPGTAYTLVVQGGGAGGYGNYRYGNAGANGSATLSWN